MIIKNTSYSGERYIGVKQIDFVKKYIETIYETTNSWLPLSKREELYESKGGGVIINSLKLQIADHNEARVLDQLVIIDRYYADNGMKFQFQSVLLHECAHIQDQALRLSVTNDMNQYYGFSMFSELVAFGCQQLDEKIEITEDVIYLIMDYIEKYYPRLGTKYNIVSELDTLYNLFGN